MPFLPIFYLKRCLCMIQRLKRYKWNISLLLVFPVYQCCVAFQRYFMHIHTSRYIYFFIQIFFSFNYLFWRAFNISFLEAFCNASANFHFMNILPVSCWWNLYGLSSYATENNTTIINFINVILHLYKYMWRESVKSKIAWSKSMCVWNLDRCQIGLCGSCTKFYYRHRCLFCHPSEYELHESRSFLYFVFCLFISFLFSP